MCLGKYVNTVDIRSCSIVQIDGYYYIFASVEAVYVRTCTTVPPTHLREAECPRTSKGLSRAGHPMAPYNLYFKNHHKKTGNRFRLLVYR